jgi:homoserine kinase
VTLRVRAPATTANLGPAFDCAGAALDLWNELELSDGHGVEVRGEGADELEPGDHLGVRAFELVAPARGRRFVFTSRIPLARGLGSSAATIALGLVAATLVAGGEPDAERLLALGLPLEGHPDNLGPALAGGVCLAFGARIVRVADSLPLAPIALVPEARVSTEAARAALPREVSHADAAANAAHAALLGAAIASGDADLFAAALHDRLHEPYRAPLSPVYESARATPGARGVTISGSGPTVIVWAREDEADAVAAGLRARHPEARALRLAVSAHGAGPA